MQSLLGGTRRCRGKAAAVLCNVCRLQYCTALNLPGPPIAPSEPRRRKAFGCEWVDPFSWMECDEKRLGLHLSKEQSWYDRAVRATQQAGRRPEAFMDSWQSDAAQGPVDSFKEPIGDYCYFIRHSEEQENPHYMRCPTANRGTEQSVLDINALAANGSISVGTMKLSDKHEQLAYTLSTDGGASTAYVKEIATGEILDSLQGVHGIEWLADTRTLLYTTAEALLRPSGVWRHVLGQPQTADELLFEEGRPDCFVTLTKTKDGCFVVINSTSKISSEARLLDASKASSGPILVQERQPNLEYFVEHHAGRLLILSSDGVTDNRLFSASLTEPGRSHWEAILPDRPGVVIEDLSVFRGCVVLWERHRGLPGFSILPLDAAHLKAEPDALPRQAGSETWQTASDAQHNILTILGSKAATLEGARQESRDFEDLRRIPPGTLQRVDDAAGCGQLGLRSFVFKPEGRVTAVSPGSDADFGAGYFSMDASSPVRAQQTLVFPLAVKDSNEGVAYGGRSLQRDASTDMLQCWQAFATSADGTKIPMTLARDTGRPLQGGSRQPCLFQVYGAYGMKLEADYCPATFDLLKRGWTLAFAHVRGGGELGRRWHHAGRQLGKLKAIQDAHACLDYLIQAGLATDGGIGLKAGSAGGVIAGALLASRPETFGAAALRMPFLDLFTAAMEPSLALTEHEWDEWGDPRDPGGVELLGELCPYLGLGRLPSHAARFPPTLVTAAKDDDRVPIWMPAKWVAALRQQLEPQCPVFLNVIEGGHHLAEADERTLQSAEIAFLSGGGRTAISLSTC